MLWLVALLAASLCILRQLTSLGACRSLLLARAGWVLLARLALAHCYSVHLPSSLGPGAKSLAEFDPYFALGRVRATFAPGSDSVAGRPFLSGAATLNGSSVPHGHETVSETRHFCAGHMISVCLALTLRWAESSPLLRRGQTL